MYVSAVCLLQQNPGESFWLWPAAFLPQLLPGEVCAQACAWPTRTLQPEQLLLLLMKRPLMYKMNIGCFLQLLLHTSSWCAPKLPPSHDPKGASLAAPNRTGTRVVEIVELYECAGHMVSKPVAMCQETL